MRTGINLQVHRRSTWSIFDEPFCTHPAGSEAPAHTPVRTQSVVDEASVVEGHAQSLVALHGAGVILHGLPEVDAQVLQVSTVVVRQSEKLFPVQGKHGVFKAIAGVTSQGCFPHQHFGSCPLEG